MHLRIIREVQLAESILGCWQISPCRQFQPVSSLFRVRQQQTAVPVQQSQEVFGMDIAVLCQLLQISHRLVPLIERQLAVFDLGP